MTLRERLKAETRRLHEGVESRSFMRALLSPDLDLPTYVEILNQLHRIYAPVEAELLRNAELIEVLPDLSARLKCRQLAGDLKNCGAKVDSSLRGPAEPIEDLATALGAMYVIEGSTLGAQVLIRTLNAHPFLTPERLTYFTGYGPQTGMYWQRFLTSFTHVPSHDEDRCVRAAKRMFEQFLISNPVTP